MSSYLANRLPWAIEVVKMHGRCPPKEDSKECWKLRLANRGLLLQDHLLRDKKEILPLCLQLWGHSVIPFIVKRVGPYRSEKIRAVVAPTVLKEVYQVPSSLRFPGESFLR